MDRARQFELCILRTVPKVPYLTAYSLGTVGTVGTEVGTYSNLQLVPYLTLLEPRRAKFH